MAAGKGSAGVETRGSDASDGAAAAPEPDAPELPQRRSVAAWVDGITENELPLFAQNLAEISSVATARQSSAADLARVIAMDISMSVRLLKIANSPVLNPQNRSIDSIRAAVVLMGFEAVRDLAFSLSLVSELHREGGRDRVTELLAHAFHAATLAQTVSHCAGDRSPEEVFVAALLLNVGEMAFWSRRRPECEAIAAREADGESGEAAQRGVLGFSLRELTKRLADEWRMSGLLKATLVGNDDGDPRCASVRSGDRIAAIVEAHGWDSSEGRAALKDMAERLGMPRPDLEERLRTATREAGRMARRFGVHDVERFLPTARAAGSTGRPAGGRKAVDNGASATTAPAGTGQRQEAAAVGEAGFPDADPQRELQAVRDVQAELQGRPDIDRLMRLALEGLHRGAGMDRALFAMLSPDRGELRARYAAGADADAVLGSCRIPVTGKRNLFAVLLQAGKAVWVDAERRERLGPLIGPEIDRWAAGAPFYAMPIFVRQRAVGLLYADRSGSGRALDDEGFSSFRFFGEQIATGLERR